MSVAAWWRRCSGSAQRNGSSVVGAVRWLRWWRQRDIVTSAAAWWRLATGNDNKDDNDGNGDGAMGSSVTGYDDDNNDNGDGQ